MKVIDNWAAELGAHLKYSLVHPIQGAERPGGNHNDGVTNVALQLILVGLTKCNGKCLVE